jgi:tetratricopeptide (TPR) repeat protein
VLFARAAAAASELAKTDQLSRAVLIATIGSEVGSLRNECLVESVFRVLLSRLLLHTGNIEGSLQAATRALALAQDCHEYCVVERAAILRARALRMQDNTDAALDTLQRALDFVGSGHADRAAIALSIEISAMMLRDGERAYWPGLMDKALSALQLAVGVAESEVPATVAQVLQGFQVTRDHRVPRILKKAERMLHGTGGIAEMTVTSALCRVSRLMGDTDRSRAACAELRRLVGASPAPAKAFGSRLLAEALSESGQTVEAIAALRSSASALSGSDEDRGLVFLDLARLLSQSGSIDDAMQAARQAVSAAHDSHNRTLKATALLTLADLTVERNPRAAKLMYEEALPFLRPWDASTGTTHTRLALLEEEAGLIGTALEHWAATLRAAACRFPPMPRAAEASIRAKIGLLMVRSNVGAQALPWLVESIRYVGSVPAVNMFLV